ncbi:RC-LH1 core complex protein PufX [Jannaschia pohangensis]|uniref:Intrinsic membrane protein PufX n=1 Tax=Jannaschia pohangensis TaxID=390807 RepID=A0A1I3UR22_9RHOB|nr:RC-LH1 core complex protein PufX [Jannaschia pohangensis]SFJ85189.1 Intrinsic membrane protein PufX [Jannaschia pohangensis]
MANHDYLGMANVPNLRLKAEVLILMLKGAGYAAVFSLGVVFFVLIFYWLGLLLPPESKEAPDPSYGSVITEPVDTGIRLT